MRSCPSSNRLWDESGSERNCTLWKISFLKPHTKGFAGKKSVKREFGLCELTEVSECGI